MKRVIWVVLLSGICGCSSIDRSNDWPWDGEWGFLPLTPDDWHDPIADAAQLTTVHCTPLGWNPVLMRITRSVHANDDIDIVAEVWEAHSGIEPARTYRAHTNDPRAAATLRNYIDLLDAAPLDLLSSREGTSHPMFLQYKTDDRVIDGGICYPDVSSDIRGRTSELSDYSWTSLEMDFDGTRWRTRAATAAGEAGNPFGDGMILDLRSVPPSVAIREGLLRTDARILSRHYEVIKNDDN